MMAKYSLDDKKFECIRELHFFHEVYEQIARGWPISQVAEYIQETRDELDFLKRSNLISLLRDFRDAIPPAHKVEHTLPTAHIEAVAQVEQGLDVLEETQKLYKLQMERISIAYTEERDAMQLQTNTHKEIKEAKALLELYHNVQADLGLVQRNLGHLQVDSRVHRITQVVNQHGEDVGEVVNQKRGVSRVLKAFDKIMALASATGEEDAAEIVDVTPEPEPVPAP